MDINKQYIESGKLELYVAGVLPEDEMITITQLVNKHTGIREEVEQIEKAVISFAALYAPEISPQLRNNILQTGQSPSSDTPVGPVGNTTNSNFRLICALGWLLFVASAGYNIYQYQQQLNNAREVKVLEEQQKIFADNLDSLNDKYELTKEQFAAIRTPGTKTIVLESVGKVPDIQAIVFWDAANQKVFVDAASLPEPPEGKVYQLWWMSSLDPLTPFDAGTLDGYKENDQKVFAAKSAGEAVAFAITLEPEGGSATPTLAELYVLGQV